MRYSALRCTILFAAMAAVVHGSFSSALADLIVDVQDTTLNSGGTGTVDVMIRSTTGTDILQSYGVVLQITQLGGTPGDQLQFVNSQSNSQGGLSNYVFAGDSLGIFSMVTKANWPNDNYFVTDTTISSGDVIPTTDLLLARLDLNTSLTSGGDSFKIALDQANSSYLDDQFNNLFFSASHDGTITIQSNSSSVPEPSTWILFGMGSLCVYACRIRRPTAND